MIYCEMAKADMAFVADFGLQMCEIFKIKWKTALTHLICTLNNQLTDILVPGK